MPYREPRTRENRMRRMAERQGLRLRRCPRRDRRAIGYGTYDLCFARTGKRAYSGDGETDFGLTLDEVERILTDRP